MPSEAVSVEALAAEVPDTTVDVVGRSVLVSDVHHDSRDVTPGSVFVAVRGERRDGHTRVDEAIGKGAVAVVVDHRLDVEVTQIVVPDTRRAMPWIAAAAHGHPSRSLTVVGVTGTNGKTTVTHMIEAIAVAAGRRCAIVGTVGARIAGTPVSISRTTPEATDLQRLLGAMRDEDVDVVAVEVSSHALSLHRVDAVDFAVVAFTNLSQDHLDFHGDMASYFAAKRSLFTSARASHAVIWIDDPHGAIIARSTDLDTTTVGFSDGADVRAVDVELSVNGSRFVAVSPDGEAAVSIALPGRFNVANALVAIACAAGIGVGPKDAAAGLAHLDQVPGRFETIDSGQPFGVIVDYAHTPEAISSVIAETRQIADGRVIVVFGAGGDRDPLKRPLMGAAAEAADVVIVTSDNPRSEDPQSIIDAIVSGMSTMPGVEIERRRAIAAAVELAQPSDVVLILGRGHEPRQELAHGDLVDFDDRVEAGRALLAAGWSP
ncbi:MAG TPA: UDP-N-acetylmuramoyl-L-alanyl-D-glutamate--2,6-diaminopimelate ligase [Acidimicrobiia bacterium]|jgi:UDP-N-acetylmuramoyl-L-alanyl-D-glutamate--2,6-diaminopimelate ligase